jgi:phosphoglycolate phosphatase
MMNWMAAITAHYQTRVPQSLTGPALLMFDLDGTLIDSVPDLAFAIDSMLVALGREPAGTARVSLWVGNGSEMLVRRALTDGHEVQALALATDEVEAARERFNQAYLGALHDATGVYPGVGHFLQHLQQAQIPCALVTNKPRLFTEPLLQSLGWQSNFVEVICGDDLAEKKPSPLPLLTICQRTGISPGQVLMVGDSRNDIRAAKAAGIATVAVTYGYNHGEDIALSAPDWLVSNLMELLA